MAAASHCYGQRLLNPFRGIVSVVEVEGADAVSRDGINWALYVHGEVERERMDDGQWREIPLPDIKYGDWCLQTELRRAPIRSAADYPEVDAAGQRLLQAIKQHADSLPFPLADRYELWLLDAASRQPLALISAAIDLDSRETPDRPDWRPGHAARSQFHAPGHHPDEAARNCDCLARCINERAGPRPAAQWFRRMPDGSGEGLETGDSCPELSGRRLPLAAFPELLLRRDWDSHEDARLVQAYQEWQAPWLLLLQQLQSDTRRWLERAARRRAMETRCQHRLYPMVLDPEGLKVILVEARLRSTAASTADSQTEMPLSPDPIYPFFNE